MGTRNTTLVIDKAGDVKVAQYGQWDGYPSGQGSTILKFLKAKARRNKLEKQIRKAVFVDDKNDYIKGYNQRADLDKRNEDDIKWFSTFVTRDVGGEILSNVTNSKDPVIRLMDSSDKETDQWVEWVYSVNFKENKLVVQNSLYGPVLKTYDLDALPSVKVFVTELEKIYAEE